METKIIKINPKEIKLLEENARFMNPNEYQKLVANIRRDGKLTSVPFCYRNQQNEIEVLSGNHRVLTSIDAGITEIEIMLCEENLSKEQALAIQLSHNSITGQDDEEILKKLYGKLKTIEFKEYSGLSDEFNNLCKEFESNFKIPNLNYQALNLLFLPKEIEEIKTVLSNIADFLNNYHIVANMEDYNEYLETTTTISKCLNIKNPSTTFLALINIAKEHLDDLKNIAFEEKTTNTIPFYSLFGRSDINKQDALLIDKALNKMISSGQIKKSRKENALTIWAKFYLSNSNGTLKTMK